MKDCTNCKHKECWEYAEPCASCTDIDPTGKPTNWEAQTHAERIRAMTDEELADMHVGVGCPPGTDLNELCFGENGEELLCTPPRCRECWLNWLGQEAEE